jgi:sporulation integral membrane protein YtvI
LPILNKKGAEAMKREKLEYFAILTVFLLGVALASYIFLRYLFFALLPFFIGWTVAFSVRPLAARLSRLTKLSKRTVSAIIGTVSVICILTLAVGVVIYAGSEAWDFIRELTIDGEIFKLLERILSPFESLFPQGESAEELSKQISEAIKSALSSLGGGVVSFISSFFASLPRVVLFIIITSLATVYFCLDLETVNAALKSILPKKTVLWLCDFRDRFLLSMLKYLRSYLILSLITFVIMIFGFMIMKIPFAVFLAFIVALVDLLPLLGVGTVLLPWGAFELILGSVGRGVGLLILFLASWLLRQLIEPKIVGKSLGLHPILSLALLYFGYSFFGFFGLLFVPLGAVVISGLFPKKNICPPSKSTSSESDT